MLEKTAVGFSVLYVFPNCLFKSICLLIFFCLFDLLITLITLRTMLKISYHDCKLVYFSMQLYQLGGYILR